MTFTQLPEPSVIDEDLQGGRFEPPSANVWFGDLSAKNVDFSGGQYRCLTTKALVFEGCNFDHVRVENGSLGQLPHPQSIFRECSFEGAEFPVFGPGLARFERCSFNGAKIEEGFVFCAEFVNCTFAGAGIVGCKFSGKPFECFGWLQFRGRRKRNEFHGNDFREADLVDTCFVGGIDLDAQLLPKSPDYVRVNDARARIEGARPHVETWSDEAARREATAYLKALEHLARDDQRDLLVRRDDRWDARSVQRRAVGATGPRRGS